MFSVVCLLGFYVCLWLWGCYWLYYFVVCICVLVCGVYFTCLFGLRLLAALLFDFLIFCGLGWWVRYNSVVDFYSFIVEFIWLWLSWIWVLLFIVFVSGFNICLLGRLLLVLLFCLGFTGFDSLVEMLVVWCLGCVVFFDWFCYCLVCYDGDFGLFVVELSCLFLIIVLILLLIGSACGDGGYSCLDALMITLHCWFWFVVCCFLMVV